MSFKEKYIAIDDWDLLEAKDQEKETKKPIGNDAFALGDIIQDLINKIEHARLSLMK